MEGNVCTTKCHSRLGRVLSRYPEFVRYHLSFYHHVLNKYSLQLLIFLAIYLENDPNNYKAILGDALTPNDLKTEYEHLP